MSAIASLPAISGHVLADPNFSYFESSAEAGHASGQAVGAWRTTVTREAPFAANARDWTPTIAVFARPPMTTGSITPANPPLLLPGPRLTGKGHLLAGNASYYGDEQLTATGEQFDKHALTAAHKTLPFGTRVRVTRVDTGNSVIVRINDRGPFKPDRIIDLSEGAAENLGMTGVGVTPVRLEVLGQ